MKHGDSDRSFWPVDPEITFLNHGSFGSCPRPVLAFQHELRERLERQPVQFLVRDLEALWDAARTELAKFVGADADNLVFVPNATSGVNTVLRSLRFAAGDELLVTDHEYNACRNALDHVASRSGAVVVEAALPFPLQHEDEIVDAVVNAVTPRTRLALIDHVTSQTGLVLPIERIVNELAVRGVDTLVDGAHAPGMVPLHLEQLGAAYYTGNCHKWICAPKGAALLYVRKDLQDKIRPLIISHGANSPRSDRSAFLVEFGWMGTHDPTAYLSVPEALRSVGGLRAGGWPEIMRSNRELALLGRGILCGALGIPEPAPASLIGSLASVPIPPAIRGEALKSPLYLDALQEQLLADHSIEVPVIPWPAVADDARMQPRLLRVSAQLYNSAAQYEQLASALLQCL